MLYLLIAGLAGLTVLLLCLLGRLEHRWQAALVALLPWLINVVPHLAEPSAYLWRAVGFAAVTSPVLFALIWHVPVVRLEDEA